MFILLCNNTFRWYNLAYLYKAYRTQIFVIIGILGADITPDGLKLGVSNYGGLAYGLERLAGNFGVNKVRKV